MNSIFQTAAEIGCLAPYLDSISTHRSKVEGTKEWWSLRKEALKTRKELADESLGTPEHIPG